MWRRVRGGSAGGPADMEGLGAGGRRYRLRLCLCLDGPAGEPFRVALGRPKGQLDRPGPSHEVTAAARHPASAAVSTRMSGGE